MFYTQNNAKIDTFSQITWISPAVIVLDAQIAVQGSRIKEKNYPGYCGTENINWNLENAPIQPLIFPFFSHSDLISAGGFSSLKCICPTV